MPKRNRHREALKLLNRSGSPPPPRSRPAIPAPVPAATPPRKKTPAQVPSNLPLQRPKADPVVALEKRRRRRNRYEETHLKPHMPAVLLALRARWPATFPQDPSRQKPWAIGLFQEIVSAGLDFSKSCLRITLKYLTKTEAYQAALAAGGSRYDLDGNPKGDVSVAAREEAAAKLAELRAGGQLSRASSSTAGTSAAR